MTGHPTIWLIITYFPGFVNAVLRSILREKDEKQEIDYNVMAKDMEIDNKRQAVQDNLKAMIAKINSDGQAYNVSRQKYVTEKKNFEFAQKKYELGMISEIALRQAEATLKQAEMTNMVNGYAYYLDWQKYYLAEKGVDVSQLAL